MFVEANTVSPGQADDSINRSAKYCCQLFRVAHSQPLRVIAQKNATRKTSRARTMKGNSGVRGVSSRTSGYFVTAGVDGTST